MLTIWTKNLRPKPKICVNFPKCKDSPLIFMITPTEIDAYCVFFFLKKM